MDSRIHTLFLWPQGNFSRRLSYYLILKGLISSSKDLETGKKSSTSLWINSVRRNPQTNAWETSLRGYPVPEGFTLPILLVEETITGSKTWIRESTSILHYLDSVYPTTRLNSTDSLWRAYSDDLIGIINEAITHAETYIEHAAETSNGNTGQPDEHWPKPKALGAKHGWATCLWRCQSWAQEAGSLSKTWPWLTAPHSSDVGPGLPDLCLAAWCRYTWLTYGRMDVFEDEQLAPLRAWRKNFEALEWWQEAEDQDDGPARHPEILKIGSLECELES